MRLLILRISWIASSFCLASGASAATPKGIFNHYTSCGAILELGRYRQAPDEDLTQSRGSKVRRRIDEIEEQTVHNPILQRMFTRTYATIESSRIATLQHIGEGPRQLAAQAHHLRKLSSALLEILHLQENPLQYAALLRDQSDREERAIIRGQQVEFNKQNRRDFLPEWEANRRQWPDDLEPALKAHSRRLTAGERLAIRHWTSALRIDGYFITAVNLHRLGDYPEYHRRLVQAYEQFGVFASPFGSQILDESPYALTTYRTAPYETYQRAQRATNHAVFAGYALAMVVFPQLIERTYEEADSYVFKPSGARPNEFIVALPDVQIFVDLDPRQNQVFRLEVHFLSPDEIASLLAPLP